MNKIRRVDKTTEQNKEPQTEDIQTGEALVAPNQNGNGSHEHTNGAAETSDPSREITAQPAVGEVVAEGVSNMLADLAPEAFIGDVETLGTEEAKEASESADQWADVMVSEAEIAAPEMTVDAEPSQVVEQAPLQAEGYEGQEELDPLDQTAPMTIIAEPEELTPLPANAVVTGKYVVQSQLHLSAERNLYRVAPRRQQKCSTCGRLSSVEAANCEHCGAGLQEETPAEFYLMAESFQPELLLQDPTLMDLKLYHPNLVPVVDFFNYTPFGKTRYYAVAEPRQGVRLSQMSLPRPAMQVFGWALQLADALNYLHTRGVVGAGAEADDILVQGDMASLASLQNARVSLEESPERTSMQSLDLAKLASTVYEAYTGFPAAMSPEGVLPMPAQAPEKVGAAFRAAIEPVQGIAPPISAAHWRDQLTTAFIAIAELEQPGRPVDFVSATLTDVGRLRDQNQDSYSSAEFVQASVEHPQRLGLYVIADGMGGHKGGEVASAIAAQVFTAELMARVVAPLAAGSGPRPALTNDAILQGMVRAVQSANDRIFKARDNRQNDMGTTLVAALVAFGKAYIINVGDSRMYLYARQPKEPSEIEDRADGTAPLVNGKPVAPGTVPLKKTAKLEREEKEVATSGLSPEEAGDFALTQISVDHSLVHRLVELGQIDPEEAKVHPHRNFIYRSLGGPPPIEVDTFVRALHPGDRLLLCSDGLNSMIEDEAIEGALASEKDSREACKRLIELANEAGGHDNITTMVVDVTAYLPLPEHPQALLNT